MSESSTPGWKRGNEFVPGEPARGAPYLISLGSLDEMENRRRGHGLRAIWNIALGIIALIAIVQELGKPKDKRTWHGKVANFVPYDFRMPTIERIRETYWNPGGPMLSGKVFGVGWAPNFGVLARAKADSDT